MHSFPYTRDESRTDATSRRIVVGQDRENYRQVALGVREDGTSLKLSYLARTRYVRADADTVRLSRWVQWGKIIVKANVSP